MIFKRASWIRIQQCNISYISMIEKCGSNTYLQKLWVNGKPTPQSILCCCLLIYNARSIYMGICCTLVNPRGNRKETSNFLRAMRQFITSNPTFFDLLGPGMIRENHTDGLSWVGSRKPNWPALFPHTWSPCYEHIYHHPSMLKQHNKL